jgi:hypothetical protein
VFEEMDLDHDGVITGQQLHEGLAKMGANISGKDVAEFLKVSKVGSMAGGSREVESGVGVGKRGRGMPEREGERSSSYTSSYPSSYIGTSSKPGTDLDFLPMAYFGGTPG